MSRARGVRTVTVSLCAVMLIGLAACDASLTPAAVVSPHSSGPSAVASASDAVESAPAESASPSDTASSEPSPTVTPASESGSPAASPSSGASPGPGGACTGTVDNQKFWSQAAALLPFDVYCPVLPAGWYLTTGEYDSRNGGSLSAGFAGPGGASIQLKEGAFCTAGVSACSAHDKVLGTAKFGDRSGSLDSLGPNLGFAIYVDPGKSPSWSITGTKLTQADFIAIAAALAKIPKA